ncbi:MAG: T9SS type A sorting domain-containing protein, partial [Bacteroidales bacterium]|nr:T9SS type A sorting domain-containing protein [Bacteroidales bacterium]
HRTLKKQTMKTLTHPRRIVWLKIVLGLLFFFPVIISSQNSVFPEKDAIWCIKTDFQPQMLLYGLTGDTVINEKQYGKLYQLSDTTLNIDEGGEYIGAIRTEERKVWLYPNISNSDKELLLYDFSKGKGEGITINFFVDFEFEASVPSFFLTDVDFPKIYDLTEDTLNRKHYKIEGNSIGQDEWIEGIGSLRGLFFYSINFPIRGSYYYPKLISLKQGDSIVYHNKDVCKEPFCWFGVGVEDTQQKQTALLYPNPVKEILHIDFGEILLPVRFELFDPQGRITYTQTLITSHSTVTPPPHSKGLHHYRLTGSDGKALQSGQLLIE